MRLAHRPRSLPPRLAAGILALLAAAAASGGGPRSAAAGEAEPAAPTPARETVAAPAAPGGLPVVRLLDPGSKASRPLRYRFDKGRKDAATMETGVAITFTIDGRTAPAPSVPKVVVRMEAEIEEVAGGVAAYRWTLHRVPGDPPATPTPELEAFERKVAILDGLTGRTRVDERGLTLDLHYEVPEGTDPEARKVLESIAQSMRQVGAVLPEEPVGVGARWQVLSRVQQDGFAFDQVATYDLESLDKGVWTVRVGVDSAVDLAALDAAAFPPGTEVRSLTCAGSGRTRFDLRHLFPLDSEATVTTDVRLAAAIGEAKQEVGLRMDMSVRVARP